MEKRIEAVIPKRLDMERLPIWTFVMSGWNYPRAEAPSAHGPRAIVHSDGDPPPGSTERAVTRATSIRGHARGSGRETRRNSGQIVTCRFRVNLPKGMWLQQFTVAHPETIVEVHDRLEVGPRRFLFELEIPTEGRIGWGEELRRLPQVKLVELIDATPSSEIYRVLFTGPTFIPLVKKLKLLRHFPFPIQAGVATWNVVGPERKIHELLRRLESSRVGVAIESVHRGPPTRGTSTLTPRQRQILRWAVTEGYFDVPRRISLTKLAPKIGVATSTLSVSLAVIEKKIVEWDQWSS
jgi:hypothetical protein